MESQEHVTFNFGRSRNNYSVSTHIPCSSNKFLIAAFSVGECYDLIRLIAFSTRKLWVLHQTVYPLLCLRERLKKAIILSVACSTYTSRDCFGNQNGL